MIFRRNALEGRDLVPQQLGGMDSYDDYNYDEAGYEEQAAAEEPVDESGTRNTWEILTWIIIALTILLNLALVAILVLRRNLHSIVNKSEPWVGRGEVTLQVTCFSYIRGCRQRPPLRLHRVPVLRGELRQVQLGPQY